MDIPYYVFGIMYSVVLIVCMLFFWLNIFYLKKYKVFDFVGKTNTILVAGVICIIFISTIIAVLRIDWTATISLWNNL